MKTKEVRITHHELTKHYVRAGVVQEAPYLEVPDLLNFVATLPIKKRFFDLKDDKFCYIDNFKKIEDKGYYFGVMESARNSFRPDLINKTDGSKRSNPRSLSEGDIERTHFLIAIYPKEVRLFLEYNYSGVRVQNFVNYLKNNVKLYLKKIHEKEEYSVNHVEVATNSFMTDLESALKASGVEVYMDKKVLGPAALAFSDRTVAVKREVVLSVSSRRNEDIKTLAMDLFAALKDDKKLISRVRVKAKNPDNQNVIIDTQAACMNTVFRVDINEDTGELNSHQVMQELMKLADSNL